VQHHEVTPFAMNVPLLPSRLRGSLWIAVITCLLVNAFTPAAAASSVRGRVFIDRLSAPWQSQQVQEACVLPNPKDPEKLIMFYSGVPASNRRTCFIGKAWALKSDPFTWHQDPANPVFLPAGGDAWDSNSIRLDAVLYIPEEDAYYIYYSGTRSLVQDQIGLAICPAGADGYSDVGLATIRRASTATMWSSRLRRCSMAAPRCSSAWAATSSMPCPIPSAPTRPCADWN
jgi:hypothetical protein